MAPKAKSTRARPVRIEIDGDGILDILHEYINHDANPVTSFNDSAPVPPVLDRVFAEIIREFMHREESKSTGGSSKITSSKTLSYSDVIQRVKSFYTEYIPSNSKSKDACLSLFKDRDIIGSGKYGVVYKATDSNDRRPGFKYAVKAIQVYPFAHKMLYENLVNEIEIGRKMGKAGIGPRVRAVHWCEQDGGLLVMIVTDLMSEGDLAHFSQTHAVTLDHVLQIEKKVRSMHRLGILHNDIHARNILVNKNKNGGFEFFLGDFGFSRPDKTLIKRKSEIEKVRMLSTLVTRDKLRGLLYTMLSDGRISSEIKFSQSSAASSSVWLDGTTYLDSSSVSESGCQPQ